MAVEIIPVWNQVGPELERELARFWIEHKAMLDEAKAAERAAQVVCIVRDGDRLLGVSTAYARIVPMLRQPMYYLRMYLAPEVRNQDLSYSVLNASFDTIEKQELAKEKLLCLGIILSIQNQRLARHYNEAYWPRTKFAFAGVSPEGQDLRVRYFEGVRLPPPALLKARPKATPGAGPATAAKPGPEANPKATPRARPGRKSAKA